MPCGGQGGGHVAHRAAALRRRAGVQRARAAVHVGDGRRRRLSDLPVPRAEAWSDKPKSKGASYKAVQCTSVRCTKRRRIALMERAGHLGFGVLQCSSKSYFQANLTIEITYVWTMPMPLLDLIGGSLKSGRNWRVCSCLYFPHPPSSCHPVMLLLAEVRVARCL